MALEYQEAVPGQELPNTLSFEESLSVPSMGTIDHFDLREVLGEGKTGKVHKAFDTKLRRFVAIKVLRPEQGTNGYDRALQEAMMQAQGTEHPNIVTIYESNTHHTERGDQPYIVMELLENGSIADRLAAEHASQLSEKSTFAIGVQIAAALNHEHSRGVLHGDVKPANVLLTKDGVAKLGDFGFAMRWGDGFHEKGIWGSPGYIPPEAFSNNECSHVSDIYSLGCTMYGLLSGQSPFANLVNKRDKYFAAMIKGEPPLSLREGAPNISLEGAEIVAKMMAKDPIDRYQSAREAAMDMYAHAQSLLSSASHKRQAQQLHLPEVMNAMDDAARLLRLDQGKTTERLFARLARGKGALALVIGTALIISGTVHALLRHQNSAAVVSPEKKPWDPSVLRLGEEEEVDLATNRIRLDAQDSKHILYYKFSANADGTMDRDVQKIFFIVLGPDEGMMVLHAARHGIFFRATGDDEMRFYEYLTIGQDSTYRVSHSAPGLAAFLRKVDFGAEGSPKVDVSPSVRAVLPENFRSDPLAAQIVRDIFQIELLKAVARDRAMHVAEGRE
jgi:hypothetical protein